MVAGTAEISPRYPKRSIMTVPPRSLQNIPELVLASGLEDQVKLNHLQRDGDAPVDVTVNDGRLVNLNPVLTHVHVMHTSHQGDQTAHVQARFPVVADGSCFREEEHCCCDHGDGDDPERDCNTIMWRQKRIRRRVHWPGGRHRSPRGV